MGKKIIDYLIVNGDKGLHLLTCIIIVLVVGRACLLLSLPIMASSLIGVGAALLVGVAKEVIDANTGGKFDKTDLLFDIIGVLVGIVLFSYMEF